MKIIYLLITSILCQEITFYISPSGLSTNDGLSIESPWKWSWFDISNNIRKKFQDYKDIYLPLFSLNLQFCFSLKEYKFNIS